MAELLRRVCRVPKEEIYYVAWTVDAYDGLAFLRNESEGIVSVFCSSDYADDVDLIISALMKEGIDIEILSEFHAGEN
jgi:hypothetical protein